ncbi:MAG TPA: hypothetical protein VFX85_13950 [Solirubrobacterales bacterium]|nr:hypothetical protein [Solirubrobacterales bacterium]
MAASLALAIASAEGYHDRMPHESRENSSNTPDSRDIGDFDRAAAIRRQAAWNLSMSERLARVHELSKQISAINGAARTR